VHAALGGNQLHELVSPLDIGRFVLQGARRRGRACQRLRRRSVLFERHHILRLRAELDAQIDHEIIDGARAFDVAVHGLLGGAHAILGDAAVVAGQ